MRLRATTGHPLDAAVRRGWIQPAAAGAVRVAAVPVLVLAVLVWLVLSVLRGGESAPPQVYAEFVDASTGSYLDVQLDDDATSYGAFSAVVPGEGRVWPAERVSTSQGPGGVAQLQYDGPGYRDTQAQPGARSEPPADRRPPEKVQLKLVGQVDPTRHVASVDVWVDGAKHHVAADSEPSGAQAVVGDFLGAVRAGDWNKLYSIETTSMRNGSKRSDFTTGMANAGVITDVRSARATGPTTYSTRAGVTSARTPISLTYGGAREGTSVDATLVLVVEGGAWGVQAVE